MIRLMEPLTMMRGLNILNCTNHAVSCHEKCEMENQLEKIDQDYRFCSVRCNATKDECLVKKKKIYRFKCSEMNSRCLDVCSKKREQSFCARLCDSVSDKCFRAAERERTSVTRDRKRAQCYVKRADCMEKKKCE